MSDTQSLEISLRPGQSLIITALSSGETYEVTIPSVRGDAARLAVNAPRHVAVHRTEVYVEIQQEITVGFPAETFRAES